MTLRYMRLFLLPLPQAIVASAGSSFEVVVTIGDAGSTAYRPVPSSLFLGITNGSTAWVGSRTAGTLEGRVVDILSGLFDVGVGTPVDNSQDGVPRVQVRPGGRAVARSILRGVACVRWSCCAGL